jgi:hypothetical protein
MQKLFLYLASRSKQGIKIVTHFKADKEVNSPLSSLEELELPPQWKMAVGKILNENKMLYEPRLETAKSYNELKERLKTRGFTNLPMGELPMIHFTNIHKAPKANTSGCKVVKTMLRKKEG